MPMGSMASTKSRCSNRLQPGVGHGGRIDPNVGVEAAHYGAQLLSSSRRQRPSRSSVIRVMNTGVCSWGGRAARLVHQCRGEFFLPRCCTQPIDLRQISRSLADGPRCLGAWRARVRLRRRRSGAPVPRSACARSFAVASSARRIQPKDQSRPPAAAWSDSFSI